MTNEITTAYELINLCACFDILHFPPEEFVVIFNHISPVPYRACTDQHTRFPQIPGWIHNRMRDQV